MRFLTLLTALLFGLSMAVGVARAADPSQASSIGVFGKGKGPLLTRTELRDCIARQERVRQLTEASVKGKAEIDAIKAEVDRQDGALQSELPTLDRGNAEAVEAYNAKVQARVKLIDDYNARGPAFNAGVDTLQAERDAFAKNCNNRRYDEKDESAVRNGKK